MEAKANYTLVGILVLILLSALIGAALWLSVGFNQKKYSLYTVYLSESASGLNTESPVKYNGVQVGFVKKIALNDNDPRQVELTLSIESNVPITTSTTAALISQGITGVTYVGLAATSPDLTPIALIDDEPYPVIPSRPSLFNQLDAIVKEVADNINKVSIQTQRVFTDDNAASFKNSLANLEHFTSVLSENSIHIQQSMKSADVFLANMAVLSHDLPDMVKELKLGVHKFNLMASDVSKASLKLSSAMVSGKSTLDQMSQQTLPEATILLEHLNTISANLEKVSNEVRQNPSVVLRGTKPPLPGPGE